MTYIACFEAIPGGWFGDEANDLMDGCVINLRRLDRITKSCSLIQILRFESETAECIAAL